MPAYSFTIYDPVQRSTRVLRRTGKEAALREAFEKQGLAVVSVEEAARNEASPTSGLFALRSNGPLSRPELVIFCRSMALMVRAGNSVSEAMEFYAKSLKGPLAARFHEMARRLAGGDAFYNTFQKSGLFDDICCGVISAGEKGGNLAVSFKMLGDRYARLQFFIAKTRRAIGIPVGITVFMGGLFIASQFMVVPMVQKMLADSRVQPDPFSAVIFQMSAVVRSTWYLGVGALVGFVVALIFHTAFRNAVVYFLMARFKLFRRVVMGMRQITLLSTLRVLYGNGVDLLESLAVSAVALRKTPMADEIRQAAQDYKSGIALSEALKRNTSCDEKLIHMIRMAEDRDLITQLENVETMYDEETADSMERLSQQVNVLAYLAASLLIGAVFVASYLPITMMAARMMSR